MPVLVEAVKNDSFLGPMTAGSVNPDFFVVSVSSPSHVLRCSAELCDKAIFQTIWYDKNDNGKYDNRNDMINFR